MSELPNLEKLHARGNKFTGLDDIPVLDSVTYLNLRDNLIETAPEAGGPSGMENLKKLGTYDEESRQYNLASLHKINMQGNPFVDDAGDGFKKEVLLCLEMLKIEHRCGQQGRSHMRLARLLLEYMSEEESKNDSKPEQIEVLLRKHIKHKTLTEDAWSYMAGLIAEDSPANAMECFSLISDFMTDGMVYNEDQAYHLCVVLSKLFIDKQLVCLESRDTIVAEKLAAPVVMADMKIGSINNVVKDEDFLDPFVAMRVGETSFNKEFGEKTIGEVLKARKVRSNKPDALDVKI